MALSFEEIVKKAKENALKEYPYPWQSDLLRSQFEEEFIFKAMEGLTPSEHEKISSDMTEKFKKIVQGN